MNGDFAKKRRFPKFQNLAKILINSQEKGVKSLDDYKKALEDDPESFDGGVEAGTDIFMNQNINMKEGTDLNQFFTTLFVTRPVFPMNDRMKLINPETENNVQKVKNQFYGV